jgi:hypothetical protein
VGGTEVFRSPQADPWWRAAGPTLQRTQELPDGFVDGWTFATPVADMTVYLRWLTARVEDLGGTLTRLNLSSLPTGADVVVNCSGLGSRLLGSDRTVVPVRGQVVYVEQTGLDPLPGGRRRHPASGHGSRAWPARSARAAAQGGPAAGASRGPRGADRRRRALLRPRRRGGHAQLGRRRRRRRAGLTLQLIDQFYG